MRGYRAIRAHLVPRTMIGVGIHDEGLPEQMDNLGVQAPVLGRGAFEQERMQVSGETEREAGLVWHGVIIAL